MNELNKIQLAILKSWNVSPKSDWRLTVNVEGEEHPITIDGMNLYLPVSEALEKTEDKVYFHPTCENITSKETEVFKLIRKISVMRLLTEFRKYPLVILDIASKSKTKKSWRNDVLEMLEPIKAVKRVVRDELNNLFARMHVEIQDGVDNRFVHFKITKGGGKQKVTGQNIFYKTKIMFPFYNEMVKKLARSEGNPDNHLVDVNGHSVSRGALSVAVHLFQCIVPMCTTPDDFESVAISPTAARLTSYLGAYVELAEQMTAIQNTFRADFDKEGIYPIDVTWSEDIEQFPELYRQVPMMDYNSHNMRAEEDVATNSTSVGNMLNVTSSSPAVAQQTTQQGNVTITNQPEQGEAKQQTAAGEFITTVPAMQAGDKYIRTEIDIMNMRVLHHAQNTITGMPVIYRCTKFGNVLHREEPQQMMMHPNQQYMMQQPGMYNMMPSQFQQHPQQPVPQHNYYASQMPGHLQYNQPSAGMSTTF